MNRDENSHDLAYFEHELLRQVREAMNLPLSPRIAWSIAMGKAAEAANNNSLGLLVVLGEGGAMKLQIEVSNVVVIDTTPYDAA